MLLENRSANRARSVGLRQASSHATLLCARTHARARSGVDTLSASRRVTFPCGRLEANCDRSRLVVACLQVVSASERVHDYKTTGKSNNKLRVRALPAKLNSTLSHTQSHIHTDTYKGTEKIVKHCATGENPRITNERELRREWKR